MKVVLQQKEAERRARIAGHLFAIEKDSGRGTSVAAFLAALLSDDPDANKVLERVRRGKW